jgi:long-chain fatty acid transport protein
METVMRTKDRARLVTTLGVLVCLVWSSRATGQGLVVPTAGPINSSMAGASVAAPIEFGSSYWNPATISGLDRSEFLLGSALIIPSIHLQTTLPANSIGGQFPTTDRSGVSRSNSGVASNLATGTSFRLSEDSPWTFGLGIFGLIGGGVNFPGSNSQPLLTPRNPPRTFGVGPIYSGLSVLEITPIASYQAMKNLAIAAGPIITSTAASFAPAFFAPNPRDSFGLTGFPNATNSRPFWGGGFQVGLLYNINENWNVGFSYKSPIWQERWSYNSSAPNGSARYIGVQASLPEIISWGVAYKGLPKTLIDVDLRYFDYKDAALFGQSVRDGGLGWRSVFAVATGVQYQLSEKVTLRGGYLYNTNPIPSTATLFNAQAPGITQHTLSLGASYHITPDITATTAWVHGFRNAIQGGVEQLPGASTRLDTQTDSLVVGLNIQFGRMKKVRPSSPSEEDMVPAPAPVAIEASRSTSPPTDVVTPASGEAISR